ncbi:hypothetical protein [Pacificibacter sp. AS14]|uniref:hypothetical protein n=1 Tax=Pacificibacter sp. AS14 TaxID=3135785 RepID=UPI00317EEC64
MFRVKLNLWANAAATRASADDEDTTRLGNWAEDQERVDACMTREDLCKTFQEKFPARVGPETKHIS